MTIYTDADTVLVNIRAGGWDGKVIPANDLFANAITLSTTLPGSRTGDTNKDSGWENGEHNTFSGDTGTIEPYAGQLGGDQSVWYKFIPATSGYYRITVSNIHWVGDTTFNFGRLDAILSKATVIGDVDIYNDAGLDKSFGMSSSNPFGASVGNDLVFTNYLVSGQTYYIKISTPVWIASQTDLNGQVCTWNLAWNLISLTPPANDDWANAEVLGPTLPDTASGTTLDATNELGERAYGLGQSVWYKFVPANDMVLKITFPFTDMVGQGTSHEYAYAYLYDGTGITNVNQLRQNIYVGYTSVDSDGPDDGLMIASVTAGVTYYLQVMSPQDQSSGTFNHRVLDFSMDLEELPPVTNDDFADATSISGASGSTTFVTAGASLESGEPDQIYWDGGSPAPSVWFDWVCPATGDYVFKVQCTVDHATQTSPNVNLAIYTGSSLAGLTRIASGLLGSENTEGRPWSQASAVGFHATSGTHYKISVGNSQAIYSDMKLSWRTNATPTGDTTATALPFPNGRIDNYGNGNTEPPPNFATILSGHDSWWYTTGAVGHVKWFKGVYSADQTVEIAGQQFDGFNDNAVTSAGVGEIGLIVYKGANYASLTTPKISGTTVDAAMMMSSGFFTGTSSAHARLVSLNTPGASDGESSMHVDVNAGDTLWICVFGLYDADYAGSTTQDAQQFELDLHVPTAAPANDNWDDTYDDNTYAYNLSRDLYDDGFAVGPEAGKRDGTTIGASAEPGEISRAGFGATRSVWYYMFLDDSDTRTWEFSVASSVDCVLGIYEIVYAGALGTLLASDDDSGPGDTPLINYVPNDHTVFGNGYAIVVDSKTEGAFTLKYRRLNPATPPSNDNFASATVISSVPSINSGTTVGATAEFDEHTAQELGAGPKDTVWYKYVATFNGRLKIKAVCTSAFDDAYVYVDTWRGTALDTLVRDPNPPPTGPGGGINRGFFNHFDTPAELEASAINLDLVNGQTYYIRVQTESGGSETFDIQTEVDATYINIQPGGTDEFHGTMIDSATISVDIQVSSVEDFHVATAVDAAEIYINIQPGSPNEFKAFEYVDLATVYYNISIDSHDCQTKWDPTQLTAYGRRRYETRTNGRWTGTRGYRRYEAIGGDGLEEC